MIDILIVLQTHTKTSAYNVHFKNDEPRYVGAPKLEISKRCYLSLLNTISHCKKERPDANYRLIVLDDDSDQEFLDLIVDSRINNSFDISLESTTQRGIMNSIGEMYKLGKTHGVDLVYFAQDDYLYYESALMEMVDAYFHFKNLSGFEACIYPYNDPYRRGPERDHKVLKGPNRYWMSDCATACCILVSHQTLVNNWELFEEFGKQEYDVYCEDRTINRLFINFAGLPERTIQHLLFVPIQSLALHLGRESERDPYIDWKPLWDKFHTGSIAKIELPEHVPITVHLGCGKIKLADSIFTDDLLDHHEIRVDSDPLSSPTLLTDVIDLSMIPDNAADCVYASHVLEHMYFHEVKTCLLEWWRIVKPMGELRIVVPNLKKIHEYIQSGHILSKVYDSDVGPILAIDMIYGHRGLVAAYNKNMQHKTGFTRESAIEILSSLDFTKFSVTEFDTNLLIRVFKPRAIPQWV